MMHQIIFIVWLAVVFSVSAKPQNIYDIIQPPQRGSDGSFPVATDKNFDNNKEILNTANTRYFRPISSYRRTIRQRSRVYSPRRSYYYSRPNNDHFPAIL